MTDQPISQDPGLSVNPERHAARGTLTEAFSVLADSVTALHQQGRKPTASEVRVDMRHRTWNGFDPAAFGFARFRDFIDAAAAAGVVTVDREREGDIALAPAGVAPAPQGPAIRRDLYRAFVDWSANTLRLYHVPADRVIELPRQVAPLEPEEFASIRELLQLRPQDYIEIPSATMRDQLDWMNDFADSREDPTVASALHEALGAPKPARDFTNVLRHHPYDHRAWKRSLQDRVRIKVEEWREQSGLDINLAASTPAADRLTEAVSESGGHDGDMLFVATTSRQDETTDRAQPPTPSAQPAVGRHTKEAKRLTAGDRELRARLHRAVDRMPITELRSLRIPVGYLFED